MKALKHQIKNPHATKTTKKTPVNLNKSELPTTNLEKRANNKKKNAILHRGTVIVLKVLGISSWYSATNESATCIKGVIAKTISKILTKFDWL